MHLVLLAVLLLLTAYARKDNFAPLKRSEKGLIVVGGFIPMEFKDAVGFFQSKLPAAGYQLLKGDAEMDEAESNFSGQGFQGKWKVQGYTKLFGRCDTNDRCVEVLACHLQRSST